MTRPSVVKLARAYRDHGFNILPIGADKRPIGGWREWKDTKQTRDDLNAMRWKEAIGIGAVSGAVSEFRYCLDFDHVDDQELLADVQEFLGLPADYEWSVATPGGGGHIWVTCPELTDHIGGKGKLTGTRKGCHHVELRGRGHQTLLPGSKHPSGGIYRFAYSDTVQVPQDPPARVEAAAVLEVAKWQQEKPATEHLTTQLSNVTTIDHPWVKAALAGETEKLSWSTEGDRNNQLNRSAMALGSLLELELSDVVAQLLPVALRIGLEERESRATIKSGFTAGRKTPRQVPESERGPYLIWSRDNEAPAEERHPDSFFVDWPTLWSKDHETAEWVFEDVLAKGRGHAIFASHKAGKSLLTLFMAAKLATSGEPYLVIYLDYEMTPADLYDRLDNMGFGPDHDFSRFRYALLPALPPMDSKEGADALMEVVEKEQAAWPDHHVVVVIDTMSRAVAGAENDADTFRAFYNHTGIRLKRHGCTWVRLDHAGKQQDKGQRGSSAKGDDVDVVWNLKRTQTGIQLKRDVARMGWVKETVTFAIEEDGDLTFRRTDRSWPLGVELVARDLDALEAPLDITNKQAQEILRKADKKHRNDVIGAALKWRRERADFSESDAGNAAGNAGNGIFGSRGTRGERTEKPAETAAGNARGTAGNGNAASGERTPPYVVGGSFPAPDATDDPPEGGDTPWRLEL